MATAYDAQIPISWIMPLHSATQQLNTVCKQRKIAGSIIYLLTVAVCMQYVQQREPEKQMMPGPGNLAAGTCQHCCIRH